MSSKGRTLWLWWWLGVLVAGCSPTLFQVSTPQAPTPSLLNMTLPLPTPTPILRLLRTPGLATVTRAFATPFPLFLNPPTCYETPAGSVWCLGLVRNELAVPVDQVVVRVYLVKTDGTPLADNEVRVARSVLPPGGTSPYGVLFAAMPAESAGPVAILISAKAAPAGQTALLPTRGLQGEMRESGYHVQGIVSNPAQVSAYGLSLIATLFDATGRVTGYRQMTWPPDQRLAPGESRSFELDVIPQGRGTTRAEVVAEGSTR